MFHTDRVITPRYIPSIRQGYLLEARYAVMQSDAKSLARSVQPLLLPFILHPNFIDSSPFALAGLDPALDFHCKGYDIVSGLSIWSTSRPYDFLSTYRTFWSAFAGIRSLVLARYKRFHEAAMTEEMACVIIVSVDVLT